MHCYGYKSPSLSPHLLLLSLSHCSTLSMLPPNASVEAACVPRSGVVEGDENRQVLLTSPNDAQNVGSVAARHKKHRISSINAPRQANHSLCRVFSMCFEPLLCYMGGAENNTAAAQPQQHNHESHAVQCTRSATWATCLRRS